MAGGRGGIWLVKERGQQGVQGQQAGHTAAFPQQGRWGSRGKGTEGQRDRKGYPQRAQDKGLGRLRNSPCLCRGNLFSKNE